MEGLIPFVIHAIKRSRERAGYRCLSSNGGSSSGGGSRRLLIDYWELPREAATTTTSAPEDGSVRRRRARSELPQLASSESSLVDSRRPGVLAGAGYHRK